MDTIQASIESNTSENEQEIQALQRALDANDAQNVLNDAPVELIVETIRKLYVNQHSLGILYLLASQVKSIPEANQVVNSSSTTTTVTTTTTTTAAAASSAAVDVSPIANEFFRQTTAFLLGFRLDQVKSAMKQLVKVCRAYVNVAVRMGSSSSRTAIWPLGKTLKKLKPSCLTPIHACYLLACLHAKCYFAAQAALDETPVLLVDSKSNGMECGDILKYFYYGAMVYIGLKNFDAALEFCALYTLPYGRVVSSGSNPMRRAVSTVTIAAHEKFVLVSLICQSKVESSRFMPVVLQRFLNTPAYAELTAAFEDNALDKIESCVEKYEQTFVESDNFGLVKQAVEAFRRKKIEQLTHTYVTLSLGDIAESAGLSSPHEAERYVLDMIESGSVCATIDKRNDMVTFTDELEKFDNCAMLQRLHRQIAKVRTFCAHLQSMDTDLCCDPQYLSKKSSQSRRPSSGAMKLKSEWQQDSMET